MTREDVISWLEYLSDDARSKADGLIPTNIEIACGMAIEALKAQEEATIEPKPIDLEEETKAWLDKMNAVDALNNIADICMDWDGYDTADGLGGLINEIWAYARYCADRLAKAQEPIEARLHLCESCMKEYPDCDATEDGIEFGCGAGNDNIIGCTAYMNRWKAQEPRVMKVGDVHNWINSDRVTREPIVIEIRSGVCAWIIDDEVRELPGEADLLSDLYGKTWRCWTSRPSDAQREATPWN